MTYEEMFREINSDFRDVSMHCTQKVIPVIGKIARKSSRYPVKHVYGWKHPQSHNVYFYFAIVKKHSLWDKPEVITFCEVQRKEGKEIIVLDFEKDIYTLRDTLIIKVLQPHFLKRYAERYLEYEDDEVKESRLIIFLYRNLYSISLGEKLASDKELQKIDSEQSNEAILHFDGLCLAKRSKEIRNIIIYKTFIPVYQLYPEQYAYVMQEYLQLFNTAACRDYPQCTATIQQITNEGREKTHKILYEEHSLTPEKKLKAYAEEYEHTIKKLCEYIIL